MAGKKRKKPRAPSGSRQIGKLVRRQGIEKVARNLGVKPATLQRWRRLGVPEARRVEVRKAIVRSDRSFKAAKSWREIQHALRAARKTAEKLLFPVEQIHYDPETGSILGTRIKDAETQTVRVIMQQHRGLDGRWVSEIWFALGSKLEGFTTEGLWREYEKFQTPGTRIRIEWGPGTGWLDIHGSPEAKAA